MNSSLFPFSKNSSSMTFKLHTWKLQLDWLDFEAKKEEYEKNNKKNYSISVIHKTAACVNHLTPINLSVSLFFFPEFSAKEWSKQRVSPEQPFIFWNKHWLGPVVPKNRFADHL